MVRLSGTRAIHLVPPGKQRDQSIQIGLYGLSDLMGDPFARTTDGRIILRNPCIRHVNSYRDEIFRSDFNGWDVNSGRPSRFESNLIKARPAGNQGLSPRMEKSEIFIKSLITNNSDLRRIPDVGENFQSAIFNQVKDDTTIKHSEFDTG